MYSTAEQAAAKCGDGSIGVYQRLIPNRKPSKVQIFRAQYIRIAGPDGKAYGRTKNIYLLAVASGSEKLSAPDEAKLREQGLTENDVVYVNRRLLELCGPAREQEVAITKSTAEHTINSVVALALDVSHPSIGPHVLAKLHEAILKLHNNGISPTTDNSVPTDSGSAYDGLTRALREISSGCASAQM